MAAKKKFVDKKGCRRIRQPERTDPYWMFMESSMNLLASFAF